MKFRSVLESRSYPELLKNRIVRWQADSIFFSDGVVGIRVYRMTCDNKSELPLMISSRMPSEAQISFMEIRFCSGIEQKSSIKYLPEAPEILIG